MNEIWKDIPGYEGLYQVSNLGNVKSFKMNREKILNPNISTTGYLYVSLRKDKVVKKFKVHQLVAMAFLNHTPCGHELVIDHINDDKLDNRLENLQIVTHRFNVFKTQGKYSSQYKGVGWHMNKKKWYARIRIKNKRIDLGLFENEYEAHLKYQEALKNL